MLSGAGIFLIRERRDATGISPFVWKADPRLNGIGLELRKEQADELSVLLPLSWGPAHPQIAHCPLGLAHLFTGAHFLRQESPCWWR